MATRSPLPSWTVIVPLLALVAAVMITANGIVGISLLVGALRYGVTLFNAEGSGAALATVATQWRLSVAPGWHAAIELHSSGRDGAGDVHRARTCPGIGRPVFTVLLDERQKKLTQRVEQQRLRPP